VKAVLLAGGLGTRLSEETSLKPKPMVEIGGRPILWHIMKIYLAHGIRDFVVCCGYKGYVIKEYFANYRLHMSDVTVDMREDQIVFGMSKAEDWRITLADTGESTMTGGRLGRVADLVRDDTFCFTYGDGVADIDIGALLAFHRQHGKAATVTAVRPPSRFGVLAMDGTAVTSFAEKPAEEQGLINGGFFVLEPKALDYLGGDDCVWEREPLEGLARDGELHAFKHEGFWQPMDTLRDRQLLEAHWDAGTAPWKVW
jgi:glucose-1-phosphate cytidylyltransferase